jgi:hypothetical protein
MSFRPVIVLRALAVPCAVILLASAWIWDHYQLRAEMAAIRDLLERGSAKGSSPGGGPEHTLAEASVRRDRRDDRSATEAGPAPNDRLLPLIARQLAAGLEMVTFEEKDGVVTARINPLLAELNGFTPAQLSACERALADAHAAKSAIQARSGAGQWQRVETSGARQVFRCIVRQDTQEDCAAVAQRLSDSLKETLSGRQSELFAKTLEGIASGSRAEISETSFEVQPDGRTVKEERCTYTGEPSSPPNERVVYQRSSITHTDGIPPSFDELLRKTAPAKESK